MTPITIIIIDDHKMLREAWIHLLHLDGRFHVIEQYSNAEEAIEGINRLQPNIVLLDINLPGMNGIEATPLILQSMPNAKIIALSQQTSPKYARSIIKQGAKGYVTKNAPTREMMEAIVTVHTGKNFICSYMKEVIAEQLVGNAEPSDKINTLTRRELEVIEQIKKGYSSKHIAETLNISTKTVEIHRYNILKKLNVKNSAAIVDFVNKHLY